MASWATRRKFLYASVSILLLILLVAVPFFLYYYKAPTCFDGIENGSELGIDCGGACVRLCQSAFLPPRIEWGGAKFEKQSEGLYNVASYIVNPNINGGAMNVPYKMMLYDASGLLITERFGTLTLYPRRNTLAFQTAVKVDKRIPAKATFEFTSPPVWYKSSDRLGGINILDKNYVDEINTSSLQVLLENKNLQPYQNLLVSVILYDVNSNAIGFSQTRVDSIDGKNGRQVAPYTWSFARDGKVAKIEVLPIIAPVLER
jgi:hypothetical protein